MREKRNYIILTFDTTTQAMAMEKLCRENKIPGRMIPLPARISAGCGLSWRMLPQEYEAFRTNISDLPVTIASVHELEMW